MAVSIRLWGKGDYEECQIVMMNTTKGVVIEDHLRGDRETTDTEKKDIQEMIDIEMTGIGTTIMMTMKKSMITRTDLCAGKMLRLLQELRHLEILHPEPVHQEATLQGAEAREAALHGVAHQEVIKQEEKEKITEIKLLYC